MANRTFKATVAANDGKVFIAVPFDPNEAWGARQRHHITGAINEHRIRGELHQDGDRYYYPLGPAFRRDTGIQTGDKVVVTLAPEGPQQDNMAQDITTALAAQPNALAFFESLPTFYRKNYIRWIDSAKRPETRAAHIAEMVTLLKAGKRER